MKLQREKIVKKPTNKELVLCKDHKRKQQTSSKTGKEKKREDINYPYQE